MLCRLGSYSLSIHMRIHSLLNSKTHHLLDQVSGLFEGCHVTIRCWSYVCHVMCHVCVMHVMHATMKLPYMCLTHTYTACVLRYHVMHVLHACLC
jgi:hypothetical protein